MTPLTNILPFHWFRARHMIGLVLLDVGRVIVHFCSVIVGHLPCDSASFAV